MHIPQSALNACPTLRQSLSHRSTILNVDPPIFKVVLQYLDHGLLARLQLNTRYPLQQLVGSNDTMLKLVKAWHLAEMLDLPRLQNDLIDVYRVLYIECRASRAQIPLCKEPFQYLRDRMRYHTKIEKFLVDFYAGLSRFASDFRAEDLQRLPSDMSQYIRLRRAQIVAQPSYADSIIVGDLCYKVSKADKIQRTTLQVLPPPRSSIQTTSSATFLQRGTMSARPVSPGSLTPPVSLTPTDCTRGHPLRQSVPDGTSADEAGIVSGPPSARTSHSESFSMANPPSRTAPFMKTSPIISHRSTSTMVEDSSSDDESIYDLFFSEFRPRNHSHRENKKATKDKKAPKGKRLP